MSHELGDDMIEDLPPFVGETGSAWKMPSDEAISEAQAMYDRGEVTLLEAAFIADVLDAGGQKPRPGESAS